MRFPFLAVLLIYICLAGVLDAKNVAYIYGDVAADGTIPSGAAAPFDQMLLTDMGNKGLSQFKALVEAQGYSIAQHYDQVTTLDATFLRQFDVIVFGLHQKVWSGAEQAALDDWLRKGGGILMYNDSAAGGSFSQVGIKNSTGQTAVNSILSDYGMQVAVDQGGGTRAYIPDANAANPIIWDQPEFEGEGVSPIAIDPLGDAEALIPLDPANRISNGNLNIDPVGVTIANPIWAVIGHVVVGEGNVIAIFDRQPMWNNGPGSDINERDNEEVLRRIVRFLALDYGNSEAWFDFQLIPGAVSGLEVSYRQWSGGTGDGGFDYIARNNRFVVEQQIGLVPEGWRREAGLVQELSTVVVDSESERITVRLNPDVAAPRWFARLAVVPDIPPVIPTVDAGDDLVITLAGSAWLEPVVTNATSQTWTKVSGPGTVTFADDNALQTTATFSQAGLYELQIEVSSASDSASDTVMVRVVDGSDVVAAINCGGGAYSGSNGFSYVADIYFNGGGIDNFPGNAVALTNEDALYNTARSKGSFTGYSIPVTNGNYLVYLQLAETFFTDDAKRVFDLSIEGALVLDDIDLHETAPGKWVAIRRVFSTNVSDSSLDLAVSASVNNPLINAIVVVAVP
ncbi:MAG: malectin domain-containing carbohydrate-binding protein [Verrucomicrobiota bacterium]